MGDPAKPQQCAGGQGVSDARNLMQVHTFCGLVGHYHRFIKGFTNIA